MTYDYPKTERSWGFYRVLYETENTKVKELTVYPNKSLSKQRHTFRNENWRIVQGIADVKLEYPDRKEHMTLIKHDTITIDKTIWHQLSNCNADELRIIEIQYGEKCVEEDIERA